MPNVGKVLKDEIVRLSRREYRLASTGVKNAGRKAQKAMANLKARVAALEEAIKRISKAVPAPAPAAETGTPGVKIRPTGKMIRALRKKLGLSQAGFAKLAGVSAQSVVLWESKDGRLGMREATKAAILKLRPLGKRAAKKLLAEQK